MKDILVSLFKKLIRQLQECPGQQGRAAGQPEDLQADLQLLPMAAGTSFLHIIKIEVFLHFFDKSSFGHISYVFHYFFEIFFLTDQYRY